jgi:hypothetical protein
VEAYERFATEWDVREVVVERPFFHPRLAYAGTPDLVADLADGRRWLLDWKTTGKGIFREHVLQLAAARFCEVYLDDAGAEQPVPEVDACGGVWLRADGSYDLFPCEATEEAWRVFLCAKEVGRFLASESDDWIGDAELPPVTTTTTKG